MSVRSQNEEQTLSTRCENERHVSQNMTLQKSDFELAVLAQACNSSILGG